MLLARENFQEIFVMLVAVVVLPHWRFFFLHCFSTSSFILPWAIAGFLHPFYTFSQLIAEWFATLSFNLSGIFRHSLTASATETAGVFYLALLPNILPCFVTQIWAGKPHPESSSLPALMIWYLCHNVFSQKNINTFDILTFIQVGTDKNKDKMGAYK